MRERQRRRPNDQLRHRDPAGARNDADEIDRLRSESSGLLNTADAAIARALSGNSRDFLRVSRQGGGQ